MTREDFEEIFPYVLSQEIEKKGMSRTELARKVDVSPNIIFDFTNGVLYPNDNELEVISKALRCTPETFTKIGGIDVAKIKIRMKTAEMERADLEKRGLLRKQKFIRVAETGELFESIKECAKYFGVYESTIRKNLRGKTITCCGYHLEYSDTY